MKWLEELRICFYFGGEMMATRTITDFLREYFYPLLLVVTIGIFGWYVANERQDVMTEQRLVQIDSQLQAMQEVVGVLRTMQIELARRGEWMDRIDKEIAFIEEKTADRYSRTEASKDYKILEARFNSIEKDLFRIEERVRKLERRALPAPTSN